MPYLKKVKKPHECRFPSTSRFNLWLHGIWVGTIWQCKVCGRQYRLGYFLFDLFWIKIDESDYLSPAEKEAGSERRSNVIFAVGTVLPAVISISLLVIWLLREALSSCC